MKAVYIYAIVAICLLIVGTFLLLPEYNQRDEDYYELWDKPLLQWTMPSGGYMQNGPPVYAQMWNARDFSNEKVKAAFSTKEHQGGPGITLLGYWSDASRADVMNTPSGPV
jgi:hypothetical protein